VRDKTKELLKELLQVYVITLPLLTLAFIGLDSIYSISYPCNKWILFFGGYLASFPLATLAAIVPSYIAEKLDF